MDHAVPVWVWLPGRSVPVQAGELVHEHPAGFRYLPEFLSQQQAVALDPVQLRLKKGHVPIPKIAGLPFVIQDAKPAGYGQDRLCANAGRDLSAIELLEMGPPDTVGAIEVCTHIEHKLAWRPKPVSALASELDRLEEGSPSSRAIRRVNGDAGTSAGGERPKATFEHEGKLWLVKMQDRGDLPCMPAREFVAMSLARRVGLTVPEIALRTH
ncbi:MAG: HipA domain-containing protein, partial [Aquabacterium sp.]|nr:HipA domain-containing protein [Aquabacterium sp.]